jgi:uncharacterized OsmC-like protein
MATQPRTAKMLNGVCVDELFETLQSIRKAPETARFGFRIKNEWITAGQSRSRIADFKVADKTFAHAKVHALESDETLLLLGEDKAVSPMEYLLHALAACVTTSMVYHAAGRGIQIRGVESEVEGDIDLRGFLEIGDGVPKGYQHIRIAFKIKADVPDDQLQELCELGIRHSPVFNTLAKSVPIYVRSERG